MFGLDAVAVMDLPKKICSPLSLAGFAVSNRFFDCLDPAPEGRPRDLPTVSLASQ